MWTIGQLLLLSDAITKKSAIRTPAIQSAIPADTEDEEASEESTNTPPYPAQARASLAAYPALPTRIKDTTESATSSMEATSKRDLISVQFVVEHATTTFSITKDSMVLDLMIAASSSKAATFISKEYSGLGSLITSINGKTSDKDHNDLYWIYSVNGKKATVGVSQYVLHEGDVVSWSYEHSTM